MESEQGRNPSEFLGDEDKTPEDFNGYTFSSLLSCENGNANKKLKMRLISPQIKAELLERKDICARHRDGGCAGRITWEHAIIFAGRQLDKAWSIVKLCERHHEVNSYQDNGDLQKEKNVWIALNQATDLELKEVSKAIDYGKMKSRLNAKYGNYNP